jgi:hypothetical protein
MRWRVLLALSVAGLAVAAELKAGAERASPSRSGLPMREAPKPLARVVRTLAFGERVVVQEVSGLYARVKCKDGTLGWVKAQDLVEPGVLKADAGPRAADVSTADVSAAGRQFDESTEKRYRATAKELEAAYAVVDGIENRRPSASEVEAFAREGRLVR